MNDLEKKYSELSKQLDTYQKTTNEKFKTAAMLFDHLKNKINIITKSSQKSNGTINTTTLKNCIYCDGKKYFCRQYEKREKCIIQDIIRKAGFDICFDIDNNGEKCEHLIESYIV